MSELDMWGRVDDLVDRAPSLRDLQAHGLQLLAARHWRETGVPIPDAIAAVERANAFRGLAAPFVLQRIRGALDGPIVLFKGPEVASYFPDPLTRPYGDLDLLVSDPADAQRRLVEAGFRAVGNDDQYYEDLHHLRPLIWPNLPLIVEVHREVSWLDWSDPPPNETIFASAQPARVFPDGILTLAPAQHALVVAAHSWSATPLRRVLDLVDVAALAGASSRAEIDALAREWGVLGLWQTTIAAADHLLNGASRPSSLRVWARPIVEVRDSTVLEHHFRRWVSGFWILPPRQAARLALLMVSRDLLPAHREGWQPKLKRLALAVRNAFVSRSEHDAALGDHAHRFPRRTRL